jgi:hypothetical protein
VPLMWDGGGAYAEKYRPGNMSVSDALMGMMKRDEHTLPSQNRNENFLMLSNFSHILRKQIILILSQGIEFLLVINCDDSNPAFILDCDYFWHLEQNL